MQIWEKTSIGLKSCLSNQKKTGKWLAEQLGKDPSTRIKMVFQ